MPIVLALVWKQAHLLVAKRRPGSHQAGFWEFPGGRIESDESPEVAAVREVDEELGVRCGPVARRHPFYFDYPDRRLQFFPVDCQWLSGEPVAKGALCPVWIAHNEITHYEFPPANQQLLLELQLSWDRVH